MRRTWLSLLPIPLLLLACARLPPLTVVTTPGFSPAAHRTVALDPRTELLLIRDGYHPLNPRDLRYQVLETLGAHGYSEAEAGAADLWVGVHLLAQGGSANASGAEPKKRTREGGSGGGHPPGGRGGGGGKGDSARREGSPPPSHGTLAIIQLVERRSSRVLWQGEASVVAPPKGQPDADPLQPLFDALPSRRSTESGGPKAPALH